MNNKTPSINLRAIDKLCQKARALLSANPVEAQHMALDAHGRLVARGLDSPIEQRRLGTVLVLLARCAFALQQFDATTEYVNEVLAILQDSPTAQEYAEALHLQGLILWRVKGQPVQAMPLLQRSVVLLDGEVQQSVRCDALCNMGILYWQVGEYEKAFSCVEQSLAIATALEKHETTGRALASLGNFHASLSHKVPALECFTKGLALVEKHAPDNAVEKGKFFMGIGSVLLNMGSYDQALEYFLHNLRSLEDAGLHHEKGSVLLNIGLLHKRNGAYEKALEYLHRSLALCEQINAHNDRPGCLHNIAGTLLELHQYHRALEHATECYTLCESSGDRRMKSHALHAMGRALLGLGNTEEGLSRLQEGYAVCQEIGYNNGLVLIGADKGFALGRAGQPEQGIEHSLLALALAEKTGQKPLLLEVHKALAGLYEMLGDYKAALYHYKALHEINTTLFNESSAQRAQALHVLHQVEAAKKEAELYKMKTAHLQREMEEQKRTIAAKAMYLSQRSELLLHVKRGLLSAVAITGGEAKRQVQTVVAAVDEALSDSQSWSSFEEQFQHVQHTFVEELQKLYPQLSAVELRVCSLLKLNLSSKEICRILNIAPRSVDMHRYRIRKKLQLSSEENLHTFLVRVEQSDVIV